MASALSFHFNFTLVMRIQTNSDGLACGANSVLLTEQN